MLGWHEKTGRDFEGPWFIPTLLVGTLPGTLITYLTLRMFKHEGTWDATLAFSRDDAVFALAINILLCLGGGFMATVVTHYRKGENVVLKGGNPMKFWQIVALLLAMPTFAAAAILITLLIK